LYWKLDEVPVNDAGRSVRRNLDADFSGPESKRIKNVVSTSSNQNRKNLRSVIPNSETWFLKVYRYYL